MHGRAGEGSKRSRHMWIGPTSGTVGVAGDSSSSSLFSSPRDCFSKDGRKISVGDCALFKPPQDSPPFIGIIRSLSPDKKNYSKVEVNWLYRPGEVKLGKGILLEAAPNEIFYSFHKDEIPVESLLHPCKVAFLGKGVDLPSGICSFVCRRIYDITNKCLWWLTDQDFIDERQKEVDILLHKTQVEMHGTTQSGGPSPKPLNSLTSTSQQKLGADTIHNSASFSSQVKGKKRERPDQGSDSVKRERLSKADDGDHGSNYREVFLKLEISKIAEKRGLVDLEEVEKLVHLMRSEKRIDLAGRLMLASVLASTDKFECLSRFVQLKGLSVFDEWLHDCDRGKLNDGKGSEGCVDEFLLVLLRSLDKLPVNLHALQMCNIGKSVNHLRAHKNMEIQRKARFLVDTWKKRVEAEMDGKSVSNPAISCSSPRIREISHVGDRNSSGIVGAVKGSVAQLSVSKPIKLVHVDTTLRSGSASRGPTRSAQSPVCASNNTKEGQPINAADTALKTTMKEEKSSSSSQSHNNCQSYSNDRAKSGGLSGKEDAPSSTAGSKILNKAIGGSSRYRKAVNSSQGILSGVQREVDRNTNPAEKASPTNLTCEKAPEGNMAEGNSQNLLVEISNCGRSPAKSTSEGSFEDPSGMSSRAPSPVVQENIDQCKPSFKDKNDIYQGNAACNASNESSQSNDFKGALTGSDEGHLFREGCGSKKSAEVSMAASSSSASEKKSGKFYNSACSSMNALVDSCINCSELNVSIPAGEDGGINLLASVAAGVMSKSGSPANSPQRNNIAFDGSTTATCHESKSMLPARNPGAQDEILSTELNGHSFACNIDWKQNVEQLPERNGITNETKTSASMAGLSLQSVGSAFNDERGEQIKEQRMDIEMGTDHVRVTKPEVCVSLLREPKSSKLNIKAVADDGLPSFPSSEIGKDSSVTQEEVKPLAISSEFKSGKKGDEGVSVSSSFVKDMNVVNSLNREKANVDCEIRSHGNSCQRQVTEETRNSDPNLEQHAGECVDLPVIYHKDELVKSNVKGNDVSKPEAELPLSFRESKLSDEAELCSSAGTSSLGAAGEISVDAKVEFDLNEGVYIDDPKCGDPKCLTPVYCSTSVPLTCGFPSPVTVAAAAKGPFAPPEDLLRRKGELGWKGSAATSAFRPAEPRKVLGVPLALNNISPKAANHSSRPMLDFDLNVADERVLEDLACRTSAQGTASLVDSRSFGGLDFDLNRVDEPYDMGNNFTSNTRRMESALPSVKALSNNFLKGEVSSSRNFDLNDGPAFDELSAESSLFNHTRNYVPPVSGLRMHSSEMGSITTWFTPSNTYPAVAIPPILPDREQPFPIIAPQRMVGLSNGDGSSFRPDAYKGAVLASSPFPYPVFPYGTNFPIQSATFSGSSTAHVDSPSGGRIWIPAMHSQLLGGPVGSNYPRPYTVTLADGAESNRKWSRQGLDLNAGPLGLDTEVRDEISSRQISGTSSQSLAEEQAQLYQAAGGGSARSQRVDGRATDTNIHGSRRN